MLKISIFGRILKITNLRLQPYLPGANELIIASLCIVSPVVQWHSRIMNNRFKIIDNLWCWLVWKVFNSSMEIKFQLNLIIRQAHINITWMCFTTLGDIPNEPFCGVVNSIVCLSSWIAELSSNSYYKLIHRLKKMFFLSSKLRYHKNKFGECANCSETLTCVLKNSVFVKTFCNNTLLLNKEFCIDTSVKCWWSIAQNLSIKTHI